jgi:hypothetical protein
MFRLLQRVFITLYTGSSKFSKEIITEISFKWQVNIWEYILVEFEVQSSRTQELFISLTLKQKFFLEALLSIDTHFYCKENALQINSSLKLLLCGISTSVSLLRTLLHIPICWIYTLSLFSLTRIHKNNLGLGPLRH